MTDPLKPLGLSMWQLTVAAPMNVAGGRLFVDVTARLASPASRGPLMDMIGRSDPLIGDALQTIVERGDFLPRFLMTRRVRHRLVAHLLSIETDPAIVAQLIERNETSLATLRRDIQTKSGSTVFDFILADLQELKREALRPADLPGDHGGDGVHLVAERSPAGVAGRDERRRHADPVRPQQRHLGDGTGAAGRGGTRFALTQTSWRSSNTSTTTTSWRR